MILTRPGNKRKLVGKLHGYFPAHRARIEPFFGAGGAWFNMPKPLFSFLNDADEDVVNLYLVLTNQKDELVEAIKKMPVAESLMKHWTKNKETEPVQKAVRFLMLSNFTYMGKEGTIKLTADHTKRQLLKNLGPTYKQLTESNVKILSGDFRDVIGKLSFSESVMPKHHCFLYLDPAYLDTTNTYNTDRWTREDTCDCLDLLVNEGINGAMSEFNHPFLLEEAEKRGLNVFDVASRKNMKNRRTEILITNYFPNHRLF